MFMSKYIIIKDISNEVSISKYNIDGYKFHPKKKIMTIDSMVIVKPSFAQKIIKRNIQRKLKQIMRKAFLLFEDSEDRKLRVKEVLEEINELKSKIRYEYLKYLSKSYVKEIIGKIRKIEKEINDDFPEGAERQWGMGGNRRSR